MKKTALIAGGFLGLVFVVFGLNFFLRFIPIPQPPEGSPPAMFMGAMYITGYLAFIKVLEIIGGLLIAIPRTRTIGLLILGPIIVNIFAFHIFLTKGVGLFDPVVLLVGFISLFLIWAEKERFKNFLI